MKSARYSLLTSQIMQIFFVVKVTSGAVLQKSQFEMERTEHEVIKEGIRGQKLREGKSGRNMRIWGKVMLPAGRQNMNVPVQGRNWIDGLCFCSTKSKSSSTISKWMNVGRAKCGMGHETSMKRRSKFCLMFVICQTESLDLIF